MIIIKMYKSPRCPIRNMLNVTSIFTRSKRALIHLCLLYFFGCITYLRVLTYTGKVYGTTHVQYNIITYYVFVLSVQYTCITQCFPFFLKNTRRNIPYTFWKGMYTFYNHTGTAFNAPYEQPHNQNMCCYTLTVLYKTYIQKTLCVLNKIIFDPAWPKPKKKRGMLIYKICLLKFNY